MSQKEVLSQDEMSALLDKGEQGESADSTAMSAAIQKADETIKQIDFTNQERIMRSQFPVLERLHERLCKRMTTSVYDLVGREVQIGVTNLQIERAQDFMCKLKMPSALNIVRFNPLRGKILLVFDNELVYSLVENYFGGNGKFKSALDEREFTLSELRVVEIMLHSFFRDIESIWKPILDLNVEPIMTEMNPQMAHITTHTELIVNSTFSFEFEEGGGKFTIAIPYAVLDPIRERLEFGGGRADEDVDPNWIRSLQAEILDVPLEISSTLTQTKINLGDVAQLKAGDIIPIEMPETVIVKVAGIPTYVAKYGVSNDKCSLKIIDQIER